MKTKQYYFGSINFELRRAQDLRFLLSETVCRRKSIMNAKIISGAFLLLNLENEIVGFCPLASCLSLKKMPSWQDFDFYSAISEKLNLTFSEIESFIAGFDGQEVEEVSIWYLLGDELREEFKPERFEILENGL